MAAEGSELGSPAPPPPPPPKRRKIEPPRRTRPSQVTLDKDKSATSSNSSVSGVVAVRVDLNKVREAKRLVILQAQHEGCLGSYKSFDSVFGNYLVPVIPSNGVFDQIGRK
ncbi:hypothetical protein PAHAL_5G163900 [Panicum hallii]|uniref:Uncharacterized protein n=1 Tax=Panicum hallii TaxID=206008 RepID=A0A2S3HRW0_9POAL|nr:uncharacterized protein LOC112893195 [Panicum hallii]PAN28587.1 hypothetical protein PAHAL_5G163900 [Panicum hallii]PAN28588.1 hypothetical protein PAHAL_5G163900 [Panicum hallii]